MSGRINLWRAGLWLCLRMPLILARPFAHLCANGGNKNSLQYREMHNLRFKALGERRIYRIEATRLLKKRDADCRRMLFMTYQRLLKKDKDNKLNENALSNRFRTAPSEFRFALKNAAEREGVAFVEVKAAEHHQSVMLVAKRPVPTLRENLSGFAPVAALRMTGTSTPSILRKEGLITLW